MQTDSLLDAQDREIMWRWGQPATREFFTENASNCFRIAGELSRLEQENQRLQTRVDSLDCAHKLALGEVERLTTENTDMRLASVGLGAFASAPEDPRVMTASDVVVRLEQENRGLREVLGVKSDALTAARSEVQRLRSELEANPATEAVIAERTKLRAEVERLKKDNHRLRLEAEGLEEVARRWQASWNVERNDLSAFRAEVQRLRANAEMDQAQRAEWQETIDKLEEENERLRSELEKPHDHGPKPKERHFEFTIGDGDMRIADLEGDVDQAKDRISTLEGRVQGITEIVKQELAIIVERVRELEERVNRPSLVQELVNSGIAEVRRLRAEMEQPAPPARNPFEDLRPPRGL